MVVHPTCRFTTARNDSQWRDTCFWTLLAYCNHDPSCDETFQDLRHLEDMEPNEIQEFMHKFVMATRDERHTKILTACSPPPARSQTLTSGVRKERAC